MRDQLVAEAATYTTNNRHIRRTSMTSAGFESVIPVIKQQQTYSLDSADTGIAVKLCYV